MDRIGVHKEGEEWKFARVSSRRGNPILDIGRLSDVQPLYFGKKSPGRREFFTVTGIEEVLFKEISLPTVRTRNVFKLLPFQIESQLPYRAEEAVLSVRPRKDRKEKKTEVSVFAAKSSVIEDHLSFYAEAGVEPDLVSCTVAALFRFSRRFFPDPDDKLLLHIEDRFCTALFLGSGKIRFSHTFPIGSPGGDKLSEEGKNGKEFHRVFRFLEKKIDRPSLRVIVTGNARSSESVLSSFLPEGWKTENVPGEGDLSASEIGSYAIPIGLALEGFFKDGESVSFCEGPLATPWMKTKKRKAIGSFAPAALALSMAVLTGGALYANGQKKSLLRELSSVNGEKIPENLSLVELREKIEALESSEKKGKKEYPLAPPFPGVSEVLYLLSTYPFDSSTNGVEMGEVEYALVKYPTISAPQTKYEAQVRIELFAEEEKKLQNFCDKFCKDNPLINPQKEIRRQEKGTSASLSFFLPLRPGGQ